MSKSGDFFIGYLREAPPGHRKRARLFLFAAVLAVLIVGGIVGAFQRPFNNGKFEFGTLTEVHGVLSTTPVPRLIVNPDGQRRSILLVGFGKMGAGSTIEAMENAIGEPLGDRYVTLRGTLIYGEGKTLMELTEHENSLVSAEEHWHLYTRSLDKGPVQLRGEIIDPKCYFGVMKPGEGKPHRACAVRCVSGGIPPVLRVPTVNGPPKFYLLRGSEGERINALILDRIGEHVELQGRLSEIHDWDILNVDPDDIRPIR